MSDSIYLFLYLASPLIAIAAGYVGIIIVRLVKSDKA